MLTTNIDLNGKTILVTGAAGFIGSYLVKRLLADYEDVDVIGIDSFSDSYDVRLKHERLSEIFASFSQSYDENVINGSGKVSLKSGNKRFSFVRGNIAIRSDLEALFAEKRISVVVNLAAQAGVRRSITHPDTCFESNMIGFYNVLELCRCYPVDHLVYASSSSIYGSNKKVPYSVDDKVDNPVSLYAATKKSNELMAHSYSKLFNIPSTGLRFFTVYGPKGRPDMAYFGFSEKLRRNQIIKVFNYGKCKRDFTYIDDIVEGIIRVMQHAPEKRDGEDGLPIPPYKVYNIGNSHPENLLDFVSILGEELMHVGVLPKDFDMDKHIELVPMQPGDVAETYADTDALESDFGFRPQTKLRDGLRAFANWFAEYKVESN